jgi:Glycosyltransferases, probably involved in cell wall biogenesis
MQFINALMNIVFRQKMKPISNDDSILISILIPARNEEDNIAFLLYDLQNCGTKNLEILIFDDESSDNTAQLVQQFAQCDPRIRLVQSEGLPKGWLGKNHACHRLAKEANGDYLLFLDADVRIKGDVISRAVAYASKNRLGLLSVFPVQTMKTFGERICVPIMNYILLTLLPLCFVHRSPFKSHAAANGQFMLFKASFYMQTQVHSVFKSNAAEDISIARHYKKNKIKVACLTGEKNISCRMYSSGKEAVNGFSKNIFMFFGNHRMIGFLFWLFSVFGFVPILLSMPHLLPVYFFAMFSILATYSALSNQSIADNIILFPIQMLLLLGIMANAFKSNRLKKTEWKGRNIYSS